MRIGVGDASHNMWNCPSHSPFGRLPRYATARLAPRTGGAPLFGEALKNFGRLVADDSLAFRHRADQSAEDGHATEGKVGAAVVDADLRVHPKDGVLVLVVASPEFAVFAARDDSVSFFLRHTMPGEVSGELVRIP